MRKLNEIAKARGQSLAQMALAWTLRNAGNHERVDRRLRRGANRGKRQGAGETNFSEEELRQIDQVLKS